MEAGAIEILTDRIEKFPLAPPFFKPNQKFHFVTFIPSEMKASCSCQMFKYSGIICKNVPRLIPGWTKPVCIGRHAFGDQYRATDAGIKGPGKLKLVLVPEGKGETTDLEVYNFTDEEGVALAMYNTVGVYEQTVRRLGACC